MAPTLAYPPQPTDLAFLAELLRPVRVATLPRLLGELTEVQLHVLTRAAVHRWTHGGGIPFIPRNVHQRAAALALSAPGVRLLAPWSAPGELVGDPLDHCSGDSDDSEDWWQAFSLTRLGETVARRVLRLVPAAADREREREFDRMRALMRNEWETSD